MSLNDIFKNSNYVVINYLSEPHYGHWVCLYKNGNTINFFDSYGGYPDEQLKYIPDNFKLISNQEYPHLLKLLYKSKDYDVEYNYKKLQGNGTTTCGRWVGLYLAVCDLMSIDAFGKLMESLSKKMNLSKDELVYELTKI
jgi:hypothetical protein